MLFRFQYHTVDKMSAYPGLPGVRTLKCQVCVKNLPKGFEAYTEVNPRAPRYNESYRKILKTLKERPNLMLLRNKGIVLTVSSVSIDEDTNEIVLELKNVDTDGVVDGGHTYAACMEAADLSEMYKKLDEAFVTLEIFVGLSKKDTAELAAARSDGVPHKFYSMLNYHGKFDDIVASMKGKPGHDRICYYEGHKGDFSVVQLVQLINSFDLNLYPPTNPSLTQSQPREYGRSSRSLEFYDQHYDLRNRNSSSRMVIRLLPDILTLHDRIISAVPDAWNADRTSLYGRIVFDSHPASQLKTKLFFDTTLNEDGTTKLLQVPYGIRLGMILPLMAAYRANLKWNEKSGAIGWHRNLYTVFDNTIEELVVTFRGLFNAAKESTRGNGSIFNTLVRDNPGTFKILYDVVVRYLVDDGVNLPRPSFAKSGRKIGRAKAEPVLQ